MSSTCIIGAYNTKFGSFVNRNRETKEITDVTSIYDLITEAGRGALDDAGLDASEIDGIWMGSCSPSLFTNQEHVAPLAAEVDPLNLRFKPMTRTECACASSSVALYDAVYAVESGRFKNVLVIGVEKMNLLGTKGMTHALACSSYYPTEGAQGMTFPGLFAELAKAYQAHYQIEDNEFERMLATVSALSYSNGVENPLAHFGAGSPPDKFKLFTADAILNLPKEGRGSNMMIAPPLRLHDCSLVSDGAAALVVTTKENAMAHAEEVVEIAGIGHSVERMPLKDRVALHELSGGKNAAMKAFSEAGITSADLDLAEVHDCFSINQLLCTEALGLSQDGRSGYDYMAGRFTREDRCPINLSGGLKAKGHPVGATGASMHALIYKQLLDDAIGVPHGRSPEIGATLNVGGSGVNNCVTVLRRVR